MFVRFAQNWNNGIMEQWNDGIMGFGKMGYCKTSIDTELNK
jgi:hypothetical protein